MIEWTMSIIDAIRPVLIDCGFSEICRTADLMDEIRQRTGEDRRGIYVHLAKDASGFRVRSTEDEDIATEEYWMSAFAANAGDSNEHMTLRDSCIELMAGFGLENLDAEKIDDKVTNADRYDWLACLGVIHEFWPQRAPVGQILSSQGAFLKLKAHPLYNDEMLDAVAEFVLKCIYGGFTTHDTEWKIEVMSPRTESDDETTLLRIYNINGLTLFEIIANDHEESAAAEALDEEERESDESLHAWTPLSVRVMIANASDFSADIEALNNLPNSTVSDPWNSGTYSRRSFGDMDTLRKGLDNVALIYGARRASIELFGNVEDEQSQTAESNHAVIDAIAQRARPKSCAPREEANVQAILANTKLDSIWVSDAEFGDLLDGLALAAVNKDSEDSIERLKWHSWRVIYRNRDIVRMAGHRACLRIKELANRGQEWAECLDALLDSATFELVTIATTFRCHLAKDTDGDILNPTFEMLRRIDGRLFLAKSAKKVDLNEDTSKNIDAAYFAGVLHTADRQVLPMLDAAWPRLSTQAQIAVFETFPFVLSHLHVNFLFLRLKDAFLNPTNECHENLRTTLAWHAQVLPVQAGGAEILDYRFCFGEPEKPHLVGTSLDQVSVVFQKSDSSNCQEGGKDNEQEAGEYESGDDENDEWLEESLPLADYIRLHKDLIGQLISAGPKPNPLRQVFKEWKSYDRSYVKAAKATITENEQA